jgi:hypothetical protein
MLYYLYAEKDSADVARLKGNRFFKKGDYPQALSQYMESLKVMPYDLKTLMNVAQVIPFSSQIHLILSLDIQHYLFPLSLCLSLYLLAMQ